MVDEINENVNEFEQLISEEGAPEALEAGVPESGLGSKDVELTPDSFGQYSFLKNPEVGNELVFEINKVVNNTMTKGTNKSTGEQFDIGLKKKDGTIVRHDIVTANNGRYTISAWEIFFKLLGPDGVLKKYGDEHNTFKGAKIKIVRNFDGQHANMKAEVLMKLKDFETIEEANTYKESVAKAMKERRLYTVELIQ